MVTSTNVVLPYIFIVITSSIPDVFYNDSYELSLDLVACINREVRALAAAGCKYIQIDEPLLVRDPKIAMDYAIDHLEKCYEVIIHSYHAVPKLFQAYILIN